METAAAWVAVTLAMGVLIWEFYRVKIDRRGQVAAAYLERYWDIDDDLLIAKKNTDAHKQHRHRYLKLCEDEFEAARARVLDYQLWRQWHAWLAGAEMRHRLQDDLMTVDPESTRFEHLRECLKGSVGHAWPDCPARPSRWYDRVKHLKIHFG